MMNGHISAAGPRIPKYENDNDCTDPHECHEQIESGEDYDEWIGALMDQLDTS